MGVNLIALGVLAIVVGIPLIVITRNDYKKRAYSNEDTGEEDILASPEHNTNIFNPYKIGLVLVLGGVIFIVYGLSHREKHIGQVMVRSSNEIIEQVEEIANIGYAGYKINKDYGLDEISKQSIEEQIGLYSNTDGTEDNSNYIDVSDGIMEYILDNGFEEEYFAQLSRQDPEDFYKDIEDNADKFKKDGYDKQEWADPVEPPADPEDYVSPEEVDKQNKKAAERVDKLIEAANDIPTLDKNFPSAVQKARIAYDSLEQSQKYLVEQYELLEELEDWVKELEKDDKQIDYYMRDNNIDPPEEPETTGDKELELQGYKGQQYRIMSLSGIIQKNEDTIETEARALDIEEGFKYGQLENPEYANYMIGHLSIDNRVMYRDNKFVVLKSSLSEDDIRNGLLTISINNETIEVQINTDGLKGDIVKGNPEYEYKPGEYSIYDNGQVRVVVSSETDTYLFVAKLGDDGKLRLADRTINNIVKNIKSN